VACYDFSSLRLERGRFSNTQIEELLKDQKRITPVIIKNIIEMAKERKGVMIFTSSVNHAIEIMKCLPPFVAALVTGETPGREREEIIEAFKQRQLKFLVNVSVLTTGFDAPHVDVIAILRPTESVSLYQQIIGRGLRLSPDKTDCLILDYTGQGHDLFSPEIAEDRPHSKAVPVEVPCPRCGVINTFWGLLDDDGGVLEHYGRKCQGASEDPLTQKVQPCDFRFRFKRCDQCDAENDIAARACAECGHLLVDNDKRLKEAMQLKDAHILRVETMQFKECVDKKGRARLEVHYYDADAQVLKEYFYINSPEEARVFYFNFMRMHLRLPERNLKIESVNEALHCQDRFRQPMYVIARKHLKFWRVREKIFAESLS
jgi:DNA repair protein RadD